MERINGGSGSWLLSLVLAMLWLPGWANERQVGPTAATQAGHWRALDMAFSELASQRRAVGFGVVVLVDGKPYWQRVHGRVSADAEPAFDLDTRLPWGQLSALYLTLAALRLEHQGVVADLRAGGRRSDSEVAIGPSNIGERRRFDLDVPITDWLPELRIGRVPERFRAASVREILLGRSGLAMGRLHGRYCRPELCRAIGDGDGEWYALSEPMVLGGLQSAAAMEILARVLERVSGLAIEHLIEREVTAPLGLPAPSYRPDFVSHRKGRVTPTLATRERSALGVVGSLTELTALAEALLGADDDWLPWSVRERLFTAQPLSGAAMPWARAAYLFRLSGHAGDEPGLASLSAFYPNADVRIQVVPEWRIAVLAAGNFDPEDARLGPVLRAARLAALAEVGVPIAEPVDAVEDRLPDTIPAPAGLAEDDFAARYATVFGLVDVRPEGSAHTATAAGWNFTLDRRADGWYRLRLRVLRIPIGLSFLDRITVRPMRRDGQRLLLMATADDTVVLGSALIAGSASRQIEPWLGRYRLVNADPLAEQSKIDRVEVGIDAGIPVVRVPLPGLVAPTLSIPLEHESGDLFQVAGFGPGLGERFRFDRSDGEASLWYSGYRLQRE